MRLYSQFRASFAAVVLTTAALHAQATPPDPTAPVQAAPKPWYESVRLSGYVIGDAYGVLDSHDPALEEANGFWIRRAYLTFDYAIAERWSARLRLEANSPGDFTTNAKLDPFVKDAYLAWKSAGRELYLGISPSPTWDFAESHWGYRAIEKTPVDLYRLGSARDFGVAFRGKAAGGKVFYHAMVGNGAGEASETNEGKKAMLAVGWKPAGGWVIELNGDFEDRPGATDRTTVQALLGWKGAASRYGAQYASQDREVAGGPSQSLAIGSVFGVWDLGERSSLIARYDRSFDPNPEADRIPYLPIARGFEFDLALVGWDYRLHPKISLLPNVELVTYRDTDGVRAPDDGLVGKLTLYFQF